MMISNRDAVADIAMAVLETMLFASSDYLDFCPEYVQGDFLLAEVTYSGSRNGKLSIIAAEPLCRDWAEMMADNDSSEMILDTLAEVTNVIGGNWLIASFSPDEKIKLNPPQVKDANVQDWDRITGQASAVVLCVDGNPFILHVDAQD